ncbi:hypothetical protein PSY81_23430, partial [Shigella flexneri]|nr:hypothetical protein [Shigella flexneri]
MLAGAETTTIMVAEAIILEVLEGVLSLTIETIMLVGMVSIETMAALSGTTTTMLVELLLLV